MLTTHEDVEYFLNNIMLLLKKKDINSNFNTISKTITDYILNKLKSIR